MSGHSKWSTIKRKKEKTDAQRANIFTKIGREMAVAVREGGADPAANSKLRDLIAKAKSLNVPNDNIDRAIKKAGEKDAGNYENITYEGYGPSGVAVMVDCLTDNRNRTAGDLRHYFDKCGGNLGQTGSVGFLFERKGIIVIENNGVDEEKLMEDAWRRGPLTLRRSRTLLRSPPIPTLSPPCGRRSNKRGIPRRPPRRSIFPPQPPKSTTRS